MSFLCRLKILQLPDIKPNTTDLCHMSLDFRFFGLGRNEDRNLCALEEKALELTFKIGGENLLADGGADFFEGPKASTIKLVF